jgi:hypothetical protein
MEGRVQSVHLQRGIAEPVAQFANLRTVAVIQVLARAIDLNAIETGIADSFQASRGKPLVYEKMSGKHMLHF